MSVPIAPIGGTGSARAANYNNQIFGNPAKVLTIEQAKARLEGGDDIRRMVIKDTATNIEAGFNDLKKWAGDKILKGVQVDGDGEISLRISALQARDPAQQASTARKETLQVLKALDKATVRVEDVASEVEDGLDDLRLYQRRVDSIAVTATSDNGTAGDDTDDVSESPLLSLSAADFKANQKLLGKIEGAVVEVELTGNYGDYSVRTRSGGKLSITSNDKTVKLSGDGAHLLKFADGTRVVASTGDPNINALLEVGKKNMWSPAAQGNGGKLAVNSSVSNELATDRYEIKAGVYSLDETLDGTDPIALTYGFHADASTVPAADKKFFQPLTEVQRAVVRDAFTYLGGLINVTFTEAQTLDAAATSIQFGTNEQASSAGYAYMPQAGSATTQLFLANNADTNNFSGFTDSDGDLSNGFQFASADLADMRKSYGWLTVVHEIGHAMGLKHPGNYNAGGGGASPPYLPKVLDSHQWSLMSYSGAPSATDTEGSNPASAMKPQTAMVYDIAALQFLYGKPGATAADALDDYQTTDFSATWNGMQTVWSDEAITLDAGDRTNRVIVDMRAGTFSSISRFNDSGLAFGATYGSVTAGSGNDVIFGSTYSASVDGGGGDDTLVLAGDMADWSSDEVEMNAAQDGSVSVGVATATLTRTIDGQAVAISLSNVEKIMFYDDTRTAGFHTSADFDRTA